VSKKDNIVKSAIDLLYLNGYQDTKVEDITKSAGIAKGTFYTYFKTKEELIVYILKEAKQKYHKISEKSVNGKASVKENLIDYAKQEFEFAVENQKLFTIIIGMLLNDVNMSFEIKKIIHNEEKRGCKKIIEILKFGKNNSELQEYSKDRLDHLAILINHMFKFHLGKIFLEIPKDMDFSKKTYIKKGKIDKDIEQESEFIVDMILHGIAKQ